MASDLITAIHEALVEHRFALANNFLGRKPTKPKWLERDFQETKQLNVRKSKMLKPLDFRYALVIEEMDSVRMSIVNVLRAQGWFVHGIRRAEEAFHILAHIPYNLVVIDSELPGIGGIDFVRILHTLENGERFDWLLSRARRA